MIHIVLVQPQIPPNTGNIARLAAAMQCPLHLVKPLGFSIDDRYLKRAGLDYWPYVEYHLHESFESLKSKFAHSTFYFYSTKAINHYTKAQYHRGDFLVFGSETKGLTPTLLEQNYQNAFTIPMPQKGVRSLNLSTSVAMVVGEALRQINP